jgi:2-polyprenyl-3-methyl-5-hydroxy-6-metoxy-1,4-benzoquinol methylase
MCWRSSQDGDFLAIERAKLGDFEITRLDISRTLVELANRDAREAGVEVDFR